MDTKALAKSKRAHSLHHSKKHHPHQASKAASVSSGTASVGKKQPGKQVAEKPKQTQSSKKLPSNWDRYEEELDLDAEDTNEGSSSQAADVLRKSKGADYAFLLSEAKAQSQGNYSSDIFPSLSDVLDDFTQGLGPLLSARGQSITSWIADDNFNMDEKSTSSYEAPFLSLNLHALADRLAKANVSERLFAGPDILPPGLFDEIQGQSEDKHNLGQISFGTCAAETGDDVSYVSREPEKNIVNQSNRGSQSSATTISRVPTAIYVNQSDQRSLPESISTVNVDSAATKSARFEAADAEAELDMLLDSFGETKFFEPSSVTKRPNNVSNALQEGISPRDPTQSLNKGHDVIKRSKMSGHIDNTIDNLLEETSYVSIDIETKTHDVQAAPNRAPLQSNPISKSELLDDFDSWLDTI